MNTASFIAKRIRVKGKGSFASIAQFLAITSIAVGVASLIIAYAILEGFKTNIRTKIFDFDSHIQISQFDINNNPYDHQAISINSDLFNNVTKLKEVESIHPFAYSKGIIHAKQQVYGTIFKGISKTVVEEKIPSLIIKGKTPLYSDTTVSREIVISEYLANKLELEVGESCNYYYFENNKLKPRKLKVSAIYQTHMEEFDQKIVLADIRLIQQLKSWPDTMVGGYEIFIHDPAAIDLADDIVFDMMDIHMQSEKITDKYGYLFDWLNLLDQNVGLFIVILMIIAFFNISSVMYIILLERTNMIGVLKAIGASNTFIQSLFWQTGLRILVKGLVIGNLIAFVFCFSEYHLEWLPLDPVNYYMQSVPIKWVWEEFVIVNILTAVFVMITLLLPLQITKRISIIKSIRFS